MATLRLLWFFFSIVCKLPISCYDTCAQYRQCVLVTGVQWYSLCILTILCRCIYWNWNIKWDY